MAGPFAGYSARVYVGSTSTAMSEEACTKLSSSSFQVTAAAKRVIDPATSVIVNADLSPVAATEYTLDYFFGKIFFDSDDYTSSTVVIYSGNYIPLLQIGQARGFEINLENGIEEATVFSANSGKVRLPTIKDASGTLESLEACKTDYDTGAGTVTMLSMLQAGTPCLLEIYLSSSLTWAGWVIFDSTDIKVDPQTQIVSSIGWKLCKRTDSTIDPGSAVAWAFSDEVA